MAETKNVRRLVHYYEMSFTFNPNFTAVDGNLFRELFAEIIKLAKTKAKIRYQTFGEKAIFVQDVRINPASKTVVGKLRCVRKDILPELMNTITDESRGIDAKEEEGLVETTHFVIDFAKNKKKLAIEYNQFGAHISDFVTYLDYIGREKQATQKIECFPIVRDELKKLKARINRCSRFEVKIHKDYLQEIRSMDTGLFTAMRAAINQFKSEYAVLTLKFSYKRISETREISETISRLAEALSRDKSKVELFEKLEIQAEDSENNNKLRFFDLLIDKMKDELLVEKKKRYRTIVSDDMITKMSDKLLTLR